MLPFIPGNSQHLSDLEHCYVVFSGTDLLVAEEYPHWQPVPQSTWRFMGFAPQEQLFLGTYHGQAAYGIELDAASNPAPQGYCWESLRGLIGRGGIAEAEFNLVGCAIQVFNWDRDHQYCGRCGNMTSPHQSDRARRCEACQIDFYPRLSPCVIMLITRGEKCLLARHAKSRGNWYSTLAGFIEPGESVENALHREVAEEVGIQVHNLRFFSSQPWPFPGQLMIGFHADYLSGDIVVDGKEIEDARWWHYRALPPVPPTGTLSGKLIQHFVDEIKTK
jgi:NAD+ diphosphatase